MDVRPCLDCMASTAVCRKGLHAVQVYKFTRTIDRSSSGAFGVEIQAR